MSVRGTTAPVSVAPMMDRTDRHFRYVMRQITRHTLLYTEMVVTKAILHGDRARLLGYDPAEHPVALQLGGDDPSELAACARIAEDLGYDEVNLNVGCPSERVQKGSFGACLMKTPELVADCVSAMKAAVAVPVTVKCRIGVDDQDPEAALDALADGVFSAGADALWVHARKAWLDGLSPKENRDVPVKDILAKVIVDAKSAIYLQGTQLDYQKDLMGGNFKFINPNANKTCGCGESFSA